MKKIQTQNLTWIDIRDPAPKDVLYLGKKYGLHKMILEEILPPSHRSKVEQFGDFLYLVLYFPVFHKNIRETELREIDIIIGKNVFITSHYKSVIPLKELFDRCNLYPDIREQYMQQNPVLLLYHLIENMLHHALPKLDNVSRKIENAEKEIFQGREKEMLKEISLIKRDILNMAKAIKPEQGVLQSLNKIAPRFFGSEYAIYFRDLVSSYEYVRSILENHQDMIESLEETNNTLLSHKLNEIVRILTVISFITFPLSLIAGFFSMNVYMDFSENPLTFWLIAIFMFLTAGAMTVYFKKKKWL